MEFEFESDHFSTTEFCNKMTIEIELFPEHEDECFFEIKSIWDNDSKVERQLQDFPQDEQDKIERKAQRICDENAYDAWYQNQVAKAEFQKDLKEDR